MIVNGDLELLWPTGAAPDIGARSNYFRIMFFDGPVPDFDQFKAAAEQVAIGAVNSINIYQQVRAYNPACILYTENPNYTPPQAATPQASPYLGRRYMWDQNPVTSVRNTVPTWWLMYDSPTRTGMQVDPTGLQACTYYMCGAYADSNVTLTYDPTGIAPTLISGQEFFFHLTK